MSPPGSSACSADIDECSLPNPPCSQNPPVRCYNTPGSYYCGPCPTGIIAFCVFSHQGQALVILTDVIT